MPTKPPSKAAKADKKAVVKRASLFRSSSSADKLYDILDTRFKEHEARSSASINEVKEMLKEQDKRSAERHEKTQEKLSAHGERIASLETTVKETGSWKGWAAGILAAIVSGGVLAWFFKK